MSKLEGRTERKKDANMMGEDRKPKVSPGKWRDKERSPTEKAGARRRPPAIIKGQKM